MLATLLGSSTLHNYTRPFLHSKKSIHRKTWSANAAVWMTEFLFIPYGNKEYSFFVFRKIYIVSYEPTIVNFVRNMSCKRTFLNSYFLFLWYILLHNTINSDTVYSVFCWWHQWTPKQRKNLELYPKPFENCFQWEMLEKEKSSGRYIFDSTRSCILHLVAFFHGMLFKFHWEKWEWCFCGGFWQSKGHIMLHLG